MHVLAIGGGGDMGRASLRVVCDFPEVERVTVADIDPASATTTATALGAKARTLQLDVLDADAIAQAMRNADIVINTSGPFFRYGLVIFKASIDAGKPYFDICNDPEPTLGMLTHDRAARENGVLAIIGLGATPGITNMLAVKAYQQLSQVERLYTCWNVDGKTAEAEFAYDHPRASAAYMHWIQQITGDVSVYEYGVRTNAKPLAPIPIRYPGRGKREGYRGGHPEAVTLGRKYPELAEAPNLMLLGPELHAFLSVLARKVDSGKLDVEQAAGYLSRRDSSILDMDSKLKILFSKLKTRREMPELFAIAEGKKDGKACTAAAALTAYPDYSVAELAGISLAAGLRLFLDGKCRDTGVHTPESILDPDDFFRELLPYCRVPAPLESIDELVEISIK